MHIFISENVAHNVYIYTQYTLKLTKSDFKPIFGMFLVFLTPLNVICSDFYYSSWKNLSIRSFFLKNLSQKKAETKNNIFGSFYP